MNPSEFMTDFEAGMRKALHNNFPNAILHGCWFHYIRAVNKQCAKLGLLTYINSSHDARITVAKLKNLPLLEKDKIKEGYKLIEKRAKKFKVFNKLKPLFQYFQRYWLRTVSSLEI